MKNRTAYPPPLIGPKVPPSRTDTILIPIIDGEVVDVDTTRQIRPPWLMPPVSAVYRRPSRRARLARRWAMVRRSPFAADLRASANTAYWTATVCAGLLLAVAVHRVVAIRPDQVLLAVCVLVPLLSVLGLWRLSKPHSRLSRFVDADVTSEEI